MTLQEQQRPFVALERESAISHVDLVNQSHPGARSTFRIAGSSDSRSAVLRASSTKSRFDFSVRGPKVWAQQGDRFLLMWRDWRNE
jgi:hypothetical protein